MVHTIKRLISSVYIGDLAENVTEELLYETFQQAGSIQSVRLCRDSTTKKSLGYGYINYHTASDAARALESLNHTEICGKAVRLMPSQRDPTARRSGVGNVFVKNFNPETVTNKVLHETFERYGVVLSAKVAVDGAGRSKGYGFIQYEDPESAAKAIEGLNNSELHGQPLFVGPFVPAKDRAVQPGKFCNVYVRNIGSEVDEAVLRSVFGKFGPITSTVVMRNSSSKSRGFGFVNFEKADHAAIAVEGMNGYRHDGMKWRVNRAQKREDHAEEGDYQQHRLVRSNLYLRNLHKNCSDAELQSLFEEYGEVENARVLRDPSGVSKGVGFVQFSNSEDAEAAITGMNGKIVGDSPVPLFVTLTQRKQGSSSKSGSQPSPGPASLAPERSGSLSYPCLYTHMSRMMPPPSNMAYFAGNAQPIYYGAMPIAPGHGMPYYMAMGAPAVPVIDRLGGLVSFPSGHYQGICTAPSAPVSRYGLQQQGSQSLNNGPLMLHSREGRASAPLSQHGLLQDGHLRGRKSRGRQGAVYNPQVLAHPPAMPAAAPQIVFGRPVITSPFSAVQPDEGFSATGPAAPAETSRLMSRLSARSSSSGVSVPSLPKPMTAAMIEEAATAKQRNKQSQRLSRLVRQLNCEKVPETVHALLDRHDVHQMASLLEDEAVLKEKIAACAAELEAGSAPTSLAMLEPSTSEAPATSQAVPVLAG